ncbi:hypothetical protein FOZ62_010077, partial [Perkinsus olseni]
MPDVPRRRASLESLSVTKNVQEKKKGSGKRKSKKARRKSRSRSQLQGPTTLTWPLSPKVKEVEFGGNITRLKVASQPSGNLLLDFLKEQRIKQRFAPQRKNRTQGSWDKLHHVTFSKDNSVYSSYVREYFDRPRVPNDTFYNMLLSQLGSASQNDPVGPRACQASRQARTEDIPG